MDTLTQTVLKFFSESGLKKDQHVLAGCSGGVDSMVLAHIMVTLGYRPLLVHGNFNLRDEASDLDERLVQDFAEQHQLDLKTRHFNTRKYARDHGLSIQIAARELRFSFFEELMSENGAEYCVLAHHADDSLETIYMNLGRGSGLMPLSGIDPRRGTYLRPLWLTSKRDIMSYALKNKVRWREDMSNRDDNYQRNYIRHHLITPLKEAFPEFEASFKLTLKRTNQDRRLYQSLIDEKLNEIVTAEQEEERFPLQVLKEKPELRTLIYHWLKKHGSFDYTAIEKALDKPSPGRVFEGENGQLLMDREYLIYRRTSAKHRETYLIQADTPEIKEPLFIQFARKARQEIELTRDEWSAALDYDQLQFPLTLRTWRKGDRFTPLGMKGDRKSTRLNSSHYS